MSQPCEEKAGSATTVRVLCVTLGGERRRLIEKMVHELGQTYIDVRFDLRWCDGVDCRSALKEAQDMNALEAVAGDVLSEIGLSEDGRREWAGKLRKLPPAEHAVLGCSLAQLRALRIATSGDPADVIIEDGCRFRRDGTAAALLRDAVRWKRAEAGDLLYFGWLGHHDNLDIVHRRCAVSEEATVPLIRGKNKYEREYDLIFCTYAYGASRRVYEILCRDIAATPSLMFRRKRGKTAVLPIDRLLLWRTAEAGLETRTCREPCCFRAPLLRSTIHPQYDARLAETTEYQLRLIGVDWCQIWLARNEQDAPGMLKRRKEEEAAETKRIWYAKRQERWQAWKQKKIETNEWRGIKPKDKDVHVGTDAKPIRSEGHLCCISRRALQSVLGLPR
eukprot:TRINITY_DN28886_c0_g1_i1.p1 TRINITY_DN28886_c0_g1~~TRINITY_DN28886_c0_g1_i1.p1  ORF type:complete len:391 (-),score=55.95 TRINITY_DN28886_c0_g1_i1:41-1213(-)